MFIYSFFNEIFFVKGKSEILHFFLYGCPPLRGRQALEGAGPPRTPLVVTLSKFECVLFSSKSIKLYIGYKD